MGVECSGTAGGPFFAEQVADSATGGVESVVGVHERRGGSEEMAPRREAPQQHRFHGFVAEAQAKNHFQTVSPTLGIGIAWILSLFRVIRAMIVVGGLVALIALLRKK